MYVDEAKGDRAPIERVLELDELLGCGDVDVVVRVQIEHGDSDAVAGAGRKVVDRVADCLGVRVEDRCIWLHEQHTIDRSRLGVSLDVDVRPGQGGVDPEYGDAGSTRACDEQHDREDHSNDEAGEHVDHHDTGQRDRAEPELARDKTIELSHLGDLHEMRDRMQDQCGQYRLGQVLEEGRERGHGHEAQGSCNKG